MKERLESEATFLPSRFVAVVSIRKHFFSFENPISIIKFEKTTAEAAAAEAANRASEKRIFNFN